ncbi:MAG: PASTA domain-containing protein [Lachnospiraceae bacterium]|nr:PASTA domain-containing protein [Lachnospiraceae bacterium]
MGNAVGSGGFGVTYSAWDRVLNKRVAVKEYMPGEFSTRVEGTQTVSIYGGEKEEQFKNGLDKFFEESRRLAKFSDVPGIVQIYDCFMENNTAYIIMEYLEGETLGDRIKREGKIPCREAVDIMIPVLEALSKVHEEGIIHRDIAPNNIFLTSDRRVKLLDFGAARSATGTHSKSLTVLYKEGFTAEEQYRSRGDQGPWTDVYAAAATLYKAITGKTPEGAMERRVKDTLKVPGKCGVKVPATVDAAILNAMNIDIKKRTKSAEDFRTELLGTRKVKKHFQRTSEKKTGHIPAAVFVISGCFLAVAATLLILLKTGVIEFHAEFFDNLFLEAGKSRVMNVVNMDSEEAGRRLENIGLKMEVTDYRYDNSVQVGRIISQEEEKGTIVDEGTPIHVIVSHEAELMEMPDLVEMEENKALDLLKEMCMEVKVERSEGVLLPGSVIRTYPSAGEGVWQGSTVRVCISEGMSCDESSIYTTEDYSGRSFEEVRKQLSEYGIYVIRGEERYDDTVSANRILGQNIAEGENVHGGDILIVDVSLGKEQVIVPELVGMSIEDARKTLEDCKLQMQYEVVLSESSDGSWLIKTQDKTPNTNVDKDTVVNVTVNATKEEYAEAIIKAVNEIRIEHNISPMQITEEACKKAEKVLYNGYRQGEIHYYVICYDVDTHTTRKAPEETITKLRKDPWDILTEEIKYIGYVCTKDRIFVTF